MAKRKKAAEVPADVVHPETTDTPEKPTPDHSDLLVAKTRDRSSDNIFKKFAHWYKTHKKISIPLTALLAVALILAIPLSRYKVLGLAIHKNYAVTVVDSTSGKPVSQADVKLAGKSATTDEKGQATINNAPLGNQHVTVTKKYYADQSANVLVSLTDAKNKTEVKLQATGRQVPVTVTNKITGQGVQGATITAADSESKTDEKGEAVVVVPADQPTQKATIKQEGFHDLSADLEVTEQPSDKNKFAVVPTGKLYFLSKQSGKIDVVKTNLDGSERQTVLAGTGKEDEGDTILLATRDWKFLALKSHREGDKAKLYLIDTSNDSLITMDEGDATFAITGWQDHDFVYLVYRNNKKPWEPKGQAIKSYSADKRALTTMRESEAEGGPGSYASQSLQFQYLVDRGLIYITSWNSCCGYPVLSAGKEYQIIQQKPGTTQATTLKTFSQDGYNSLSASPYKPNEIYFTAWPNGKEKPEIYEYEDGQIKAASADANPDKPYPRYVLSPSATAQFWAEARDGKNTLFIGDKDGENGQNIATLSELNPYGWYTDDYLLVSKKDSELYIMGKSKDSTPLKVSDYHKPAFNNNGYGGGY